jgi:RimJ/RimL family protein N-acetyltransferase
MFIPADLILEDEFVRLLPLQLSDFDHLKYYPINEPDTWRFSLVSVVGEEGMKGYIQTAVDGRTAGHSFPFIVFDKKAGAYAGCTRFYDIQWGNKTLQLGYTWYGEAFRGTKLNKHCKFLLLQYAFENLQMERVEFRADASNQRSIAAMQSIGCTIEGILRSHAPIQTGGRRNSIVLSILKNEWENGVKENLMAKL